MSLDLISNMMSSIKNASMTGKTVIEVPFSKECEEIAKVLKNGKMLSEVKVYKLEKSSRKMIHLEIAKNDGLLAITETKRVSKPGRRIYRGSKEIKFLPQSIGVVVVSTSKGIMDGNTAKKKHLGGEILCEVM